MHGMAIWHGSVADETLLVGSGGTCACVFDPMLKCMGPVAETPRPTSAGAF